MIDDPKVVAKVTATLLDAVRELVRLRAEGSPVPEILERADRVHPTDKRTVLVARRVR